jgi:ribose/xylose/arabinose/galactoside ABC-type transport system permease subunit
VTGDVELPASQALDRAHTERSAETAMKVTIIKSVGVSVPIAIAFFVGLVALAVRNQQPDWNAWIAMAAGIGVIAGVFFGLLMGFTLTSHNFE